MEFILRTHGISKKYKKDYALNKVNINIKKGDIYGFIGRNGAGKTTLIKIITGLIKSSEGNIELFGESLDGNIGKVRKNIGALIESPAYVPDMTAYENLELLRLQKGIPGKECINEKLLLVGLENTGKKKVKDFSLGMKQKLGIAMALLADPEFLILDEPTNGLDPTGIIEMRAFLKKLNKEKNITILISSHILEELHQVATCYGIINKGNLIEEITKEELDEKCKRAIELKTNNNSKAISVIEEVLGCKKYKVYPDGIIKVYEFLDNPGKLSVALANENIIIEQIVVKGDSLENYFIDLVGGRE